MFAHRVTMNLKADAAPELTRVTETVIIPLLRHEKGFCGEVISITAELSCAARDSYWETKEDADAYHPHRVSGELEVPSQCGSWTSDDGNL